MLNRFWTGMLLAGLVAWAAGPIARPALGEDESAKKTDAPKKHAKKAPSSDAQAGKTAVDKEEKSSSEALQAPAEAGFRSA